jgi:hypothetical protein
LGIGCWDPRSQKRDLGHPSMVADAANGVIAPLTRLPSSVLGMTKESFDSQGKWLLLIRRFSNLIWTGLSFQWASRCSARRGHTLRFPILGQLLETGFPVSSRCLSPGEVSYHPAFGDVFSDTDWAMGLPLAVESTPHSVLLTILKSHFFSPVFGSIARIAPYPSASVL